MSTVSSSAFTVSKKKTPVVTKKAAGAAIVEETPKSVLSEPASFVSAPEEQTADTMTPEDRLTAGFQDIFSKVIDITMAAKALNQTAKVLFKEYVRYKRTVKPTKRKARPAGAEGEGERRPSGFDTPVTLSPELYEFLGVPPGTEMSRTQVNKRLFQYVRSNELRKEENKRIILPDEALAKLLNAPEDKEINYFNIQTYMKHHFNKKEKVPAAAAAHDAHTHTIKVIA